MLDRLLMVALLALSPWVLAQEPDELEYPRTILIGENQLLVHHPVIDRWDDFRSVQGWIPVEAHLAGTDKPFVGAVRARADTRVDLARRWVHLSGQQVLEVRFSDPNTPGLASELATRAVHDHPQTIVLDALLGALAEDFQVPAQGAAPADYSHEPPRIVVAERPTQLLLIDGQPISAPISGTGLEFVVNTDWKLFHHPDSGRWFVLNGGAWQTHSMLATGGWETTTDLPDDFRVLTLNDDWAEVRAAYPARAPESEPAPFVVNLGPAELLLIDGEARLDSAGDGGLEYVTNTDRDLFRLGGRWYVLLAGRWFQAEKLDGQWQTVDGLPGVFTTIPETHPRARARASVPGTIEAVVTMMEATLPRRQVVSTSAGDEVEVMYAGDPRFELVEGTALRRAVNSPSWVFQHNNFYYLCQDAAWFMASTPQGPWSVARSVPDDLHRIPATDPAYFVTFVRPASIAATPSSEAWFEYNSGYLGAFSTGMSVVHGTGWTYTPWIWFAPSGYPVYWSHPWTYGAYHGRGPYGHPLHYFGAFGGSTRLTFASAPRGVSGEYDPAFQDARLARAGYDYSTLEEQRAGAALNADDDYYTDSYGNVYRLQGDDWARSTPDGWSTMAELDRQYGGRPAAGSVEAAPTQQQAYKQNPNDIERMKRYHEQRKRNYNIYANVYIYH